jgi:hypothetical protein
MKKCSKCKKTKDNSKFNRRGKKLSSFCKECNKQYLKEHYKKNKRLYAKRNKKRTLELKKKARDYKVTAGCQHCGESHPACLSFHHINPKDKLFTIHKAVNNRRKLHSTVT